MPSVLSVFGVEPLRIGGTESFACELSRQLGAAGWQSVLCFESTPPAPIASYLALPNVLLEALAAPWQASRSSVSGMARLLRRHRPDILHLHFTGLVSPYPWLARVLGTRQIYFTDQTSRAAGFVPRRPSLVKRVATRGINWPMSAVTTASEYGHRCLAALEVLPSSRLHVIYNAVDLSRVSKGADVAGEFRRRHRIPAGRSLVVQVSWLIPEKGIGDLLDAARLVVDRNPKVHFVLVGEGPHRERYAERARELGLADHVTFTGLVQDPLAEGVYAAADVVCQVSRWEEIFGWTIAEAMASHKPVVATRVGGIPEVVVDGKTGLLVPPAEPRLIAGRILDLLADPALRHRLGQAGRARVETRFDLTRNVSELLHLYGVTPGRRHHEGRQALRLA